jgi:ring-1,2-phenylacetyl-CoA epoxidase subunit PaaC
VIGSDRIAMDFEGAPFGDGRERALALLLLSMADDEFVIGFSDSEWTGIGPILEEDVAISSLAQDELGHAQALYGLLVDLVADGRDVDAWAFDRPPEGYLHARLLDHSRGDWATTIARRYLYDTADAARLAALAASSYRPLAELVAKLQREERYHRMHVEVWIERLGRAGGESRERLVSALEALAPDASTVLAPLPGEAALLRHEILDRPWSEVAAGWRAEVDARFAALGLPALPPGDGSTDAPRSRHSDAFRALHADFTSVRRLEPGATW